MKLLARYNRVTLITIIFILLVTGFCYYPAIGWVLARQSDKDLRDEEMEIVQYINLNHRLPQIFESKYQQITFTQAVPGTVKRRVVDTPFFKKWGAGNLKRKKYHRDGEYDAGRALVTSVVVGNACYRVVIIQSTAETEDLIRIIFSITIGMVLLLVITLVITNRLILNKLWQPFYTIMAGLENFAISDTKTIPHLDTPVDEFKGLNRVVFEMTEKAKADYKSLKLSPKMPPTNCLRL